MFKRKAYNSLVEWKRVSNGSTAALVEGARRIGKSTVAEAFAQAEYTDYLLLDFSKEALTCAAISKRTLATSMLFFATFSCLKAKV